MKTEPKKIISRSVYLQALGLFTIGRRHYERAREAEIECGRLLGIWDDDVEHAGHVSDAMYERGGNLDTALRLERIVVEGERGTP